MTWRWVWKVVGLALLTVVAALAAVAAVFFLVILIQTWPQSHLQEWDSAPEVSADDRSVRVLVPAGCGQHTEAEVEETAMSVTITVTVKDDWFVMSCHDAIEILSEVVELDQPLGDRELIDGAA